jgi:glutathione S-transferase
LSPWVRRVIICLEEKEIEYEHEDFFPFGELSGGFRLPKIRREHSAKTAETGFWQFRQ